jgi:hypothetical protein
MSYNYGIRVITTQLSSFLTDIVHILSNPAWGGAGVVVSSIISTVALIQTRRTQPHTFPRRQHSSKKIAASF